MSDCVVDASVIAAAFFQEEHADASGALLASAQSLQAPDLIYAETANVIWKRHRRSEIDAEEASQLLDDMMQLPLQVTPSADLVGLALQLSLQFDRTVYDCLYLALAAQIDLVMLTADQRLVNSLKGSPLERHLAWIGDQS